MKNRIILTMLCLILFTSVKAKVLFNYNDSITSSNERMLEYYDSDLYLMNSLSSSNIPFGYNGSVYNDDKFINNGYLNIMEFTVAGGKSSYLFDGGEYFTMSKSGSNVNLIKNNEQGYSILPQSTTSAVRTTEIVLDNVTVSGEGTYNKPWIFDKKYRPVVIEEPEDDGEKNVGLKVDKVFSLGNSQGGQLSIVENENNKLFHYSTGSSISFPSSYFADNTARSITLNGYYSRSLFNLNIDKKMDGAFMNNDALIYSGSHTGSAFVIAKENYIYKFISMSSSVKFNSYDTVDRSSYTISKRNSYNDMIIVKLNNNMKVVEKPKYVFNTLSEGVEYINSVDLGNGNGFVQLYQLSQSATIPAANTADNRAITLSTAYVSPEDGCSVFGLVYYNDDGKVVRATMITTNNRAHVTDGQLVKVKNGFVLSGLVNATNTSYSINIPATFSNTNSIMNIISNTNKHSKFSILFNNQAKSVGSTYINYTYNENLGLGYSYSVIQALGDGSYYDLFRGSFTSLSIPASESPNGVAYTITNNTPNDVTRDLAIHTFYNKDNGNIGSFLHSTTSVPGGSAQNFYIQKLNDNYYQPTGFYQAYYKIPGMCTVSGSDFVIGTDTYGRYGILVYNEDYKFNKEISMYNGAQYGTAVFSEPTVSENKKDMLFTGYSQYGILLPKEITKTNEDVLISTNGSFNGVIHFMLDEDDNVLSYKTINGYTSAKHSGLEYLTSKWIYRIENEYLIVYEGSAFPQTIPASETVDNKDIVLNTWNSFTFQNKLVFVLYNNNGKVKSAISLPYSNSNNSSNYNAPVEVNGITKNDNGYWIAISLRNIQYAQDLTRVKIQSQDSTDGVERILSPGSVLSNYNPSSYLINLVKVNLE